MTAPDPKPLLLREHRRLLSEAMETVVELGYTREAVHAHCAAKLEPWGVTFTPEQVTVIHTGHDARIDWDTWVVYIEGYGVFGMCNQRPLGCELWVAPPST